MERILKGKKKEKTKKRRKIYL